MRRSSRDPDTGNATSQTTSPVGNINFTFVNQAEDIISLSHRKINDVTQRHAIRSHVMQRVRQEELAQGKKRPTGRDLPKRTTRVPIRSRSSDSDSSGHTELLSPLPGAFQQDPAHLKSRFLIVENRKVTSLTHRIQGKRVPLNVSPAVHEFDPFQTLPHNGLPHQSVESMMQYCFDTLLPFTFSAESTSQAESTARQGMVLRSKVNSPAVFLGFMATVAAHRAIFRGYHKDLSPSGHDHDDLITDPDYKKVKHATIVAVRQLIQDRPKADQYLIDACFGLVSIATVVGNFNEARVHLHGIAQMISMVGTSPESMTWLPIANVKVSTAMLCRPSLPIPWNRQDIPQELLLKIAPPPSLDPYRSGTSFAQLADLSDQIKLLLSKHRDICNLCEFNAINRDRLSSLEHATLSRKATELEHDYVAYPYETAEFLRNGGREPAIYALEATIRLAGLGLLSSTPHTIMPASGSGRAITHHQKKGLERWLREKPHDVSVIELRVIMWALFVFIERAELQPEATFFTQHLAHVLRDLWLLRWQDVETIMHGFLYSPQLQAKQWEKIWESVVQVQQHEWMLGNGVSQGVV